MRPLPRCYRGHVTPATPPHAVETWHDGPFSGRAEIWREVVLPRSASGAPTFDLVVWYDARFDAPLVLATPLRLSPSDVRALFLERWTVEHPPLVAKQLLGAQRQFVFGVEARQRRPELALFAATVLAYVAATSQAVATGFWDRAPQPTAGRLRRVLANAVFPRDFPLLAEIRRKDSRTDHLPKGVDAPRRHPSTDPHVSQPAAHA